MTSPVDNTPVGQPHRLRAFVREELKKFGVLAEATTDAALIREFLADLYVYQLRRLRDQLLAGAFPKTEYAGRVLAIRQQYALLSLPLSRWIEPTDSPEKERATPP
ncbi:MAG TPA: hypothetical protein VNM72_11215 [Blastocatellia bacterium]|nr:hypothetical protein [Blastocatellia bacterium]